MRYYEISGGLRLPISEEEQDFINVLLVDGRVPRSKLDERQQELARLMVGRGLVNRGRTKDDVYYTANGLTDLWRF